MDFELVGDITDVETIAKGRGIRELARLRRLYGKGRWRKMKGIARIRLSDESPNYIGMKHMASAKRNSSATGTSIERRRNTVDVDPQFAVCVDNDGYGASLERNKIYVVVPDKAAERDGDLRHRRKWGRLPVRRRSLRGHRRACRCQSLAPQSFIGPVICLSAARARRARRRRAASAAPSLVTARSTQPSHTSAACRACRRCRGCAW